MTKRDFEFIAGVISNLPRENAVRYKACQEFADHLRIVNPRFDERIFMDACNVSQLIIPASRIHNNDHVCNWGEVATFVTAEHDDGTKTMTIAFKDENGDTDTSCMMDCNGHDALRIERLQS